MSRRAPNPAADRAAANQSTIKTLLKLEGNKSCADCKRNKHPRWASWNLGIFVCIRCSGIHRGMGTHISRVKSVDLDAWTDEHLQGVLKWGNARANKYWEAKLAAGHVPSEAKIENFIRTKYESKRWVMDGPMPDPASLETEGDDDVPLNIVKEKAQLDRSTSQRASSASIQPNGPPRRPPQNMDILGDIPTPPARPSTTEPSSRAAPPKASVPTKAPAKQGDSLLCLDFFGGPPSAPADVPFSASGNALGSSGPSRPDLKQSILSLYASAPKQQAQPQHDRQSSFGGMQSPPMQPPAQPPSFGGLGDAFGGLNFSSPTSPPALQPQQQKADPFANFNNPSNQRSTVAPPQLTSPPLSGGDFFDTTPKPAAKPAPASKPSFTTSQPPKPLSMPNDDFGDFSFASSPPKPTSKPASAGAPNDLFGLSSPSAPAPAPVTQKPSSTSINLQSAFNLSAPAPSQPKSAPIASSTASNAFSGFSNSDAWGSNDAWATPDPAPTTKGAPSFKSPPISTSSNDLAWGTAPSSNGGLGSGGFGSQAPPKVTADEDFGGWSSAAPISPPLSKPAPPSNNSKPSGSSFGGSDDLFSNVWE